MTNLNSNKKIMIVDDSAFMRSVLINILQNDGYTNFVEAGDGKQALGMLTTEKPDLILLDIIMPEMTGIEFLKQAGNSWKVIIVSAVGQEKIVEEAKLLGILGYIIKPFDNRNVIEEVAKAFNA